MYNDHDRPSTTRIAMTAGLAIAGIAAAIAVASVVFGMTLGRSQTAAPFAPKTATSVQAPATATAEIPAAEPAVAPKSMPASAPSAPVAAPVQSAPAAAAPAVANASLGVVVIDAGHEGTPPKGTEPIGPGSSTMKVKLESGATGVVTHVEESQRNLDVALRLQRELEARGVKVVMIRTSQNVKISNKQRAEIANQVGAALFIRLHCDSSTSPSVRGVLTLRPGKDWYPSHPIVAKSAIAAKIIHKATLAATGAYDRGVTPRSDLTGFNWSEVPSVLVEMGLLSNPAEDRKLGTAGYQDRLAQGMADGIVAYLRR